MHLKSLVLKGFKSFADRSVISLEPGITAVVGPNGSGKSNISDAVLWVLGERNAKNLRGQAMEDVIFAGSSARKSVGVAEVDLVLDNSDQTLPVDFSEVSLTRRMYRSGESEYLINGAPARRMDFMDILHDTGLGTGTHSIISQGSLDSILASKPEDRRALIEEAAGVLKHKQRKERSAKKLATMDAHLDRVKDVAAEIERQLKPLARKAQRATAYAGLSEELAQLDLMLAVDDLRVLQGKWDATCKAEVEAAANIDVQRIKLQRAEEDLEKLQLALQEKGLYVGDLTTQRGRFHMIVERLDSAERLLDEKSKSIRIRLEQAENTASGSARRIAGFEDEVAVLDERLHEQVALRDSLDEQVTSLVAQHALAHEARVKTDAELADVQVLLRKREHEMDSFISKRAQLQDSLAGKMSNKNLLESKQEETGEELDRATEQLEECCRGLDAEAEELAKLLEQSKAAADQVDAAKRALTLAQSGVDECRTKKQNIAAQIAALEQLSKSVQSKNAASAWVLEHGKQLDASMQAFVEQVKAPQHLESLVELLLGEDLAGQFVPAARSAQEIVAQLRGAGVSGSASVLFADEVNAAAQNVAAAAPMGARLLDQLEYPAAMASTLEALLGDVVLVDNVDEALAAHQDAGVRVRYATPDGTVVVPGAKIAFNAQESAEDGMLARERSLAVFRQQLAAAEEALGAAVAAHVAAEADLERKQAMSLDLSQTHAQKKGANASAQAERQRLAKRVGVLESQVASIERDLAKAIVELGQVEPQITALSQSIEEAKAARAGLEERMNVLSADRGVAYDKEQSASALLADAKLKFATAKERVLSYTRELRERQHDLERAMAAKQRAEKDLEKLRAASVRVRPLHEVLQSLKASAQAWVDDLASKAALEQSNSESLNTAIADAREAVQVAKAAHEATTTALNDVRVEKGRLEVQVEAAISAIVHDCNTPLDVALQIPAPEDRAQAEGDAFKLRRRIANMGTIDSSAAEEYETAKARFDYMAGQIEDMEAARRALKRIVAAIDERMKDQFDITFAQVNENFQRIFAQLFPGGSASLSLVNEDDPDNLGVEVQAQPAGKRITKMMLMSGGEKSLTAIALLFAVYSIRRTPFYILDEVEAALDDSNLRRLVTYLETLRNETQLIMITHQRRTMEMSDVLYGVSMQADGVTKVVSQRLERAIAQSNG